MDLTAIRETVADAWQRFEDYYKYYTQSTISLLKEVNDYVAQRSGKRLRPLLLLLADGGRDVERAARLAVAVEMLHNASLMHDDVIDDDDMRRGQASVKSRWNNHVAVLCGDYYLATVMTIISDVDDSSAMHEINDTVRIMAEGELLQQQFIGSPVFSTDDYLDIIYRKTGALMQTCCTLGSAHFKEFGRAFGTAFQLRDDIMDYDEPDAMKKPPIELLRDKLSSCVGEALAQLAAMPQTAHVKALDALTRQLMICDE